MEDEEIIIAITQFREQLKTNGEKTEQMFLSLKQSMDDWKISNNGKLRMIDDRITENEKCIKEAKDEVRDKITKNESSIVDMVRDIKLLSEKIDNKVEKDDFESFKKNDFKGFKEELSFITIPKKKITDNILWVLFWIAFFTVALYAYLYKNII